MTLEGLVLEVGLLVSPLGQCCLARVHASPHTPALGSFSPAWGDWHNATVNLNGAEFGLGSTILARIPIAGEVVVVVGVVAAERSSVGPAGSVAGIRGMLRSERASGGENCGSLELFGPGWLPVVASAHI